MFTLSPATRIYLAAGATDLRKSFEGLSDLVTQGFKEDPLSGHLFLFVNRRKNRLKVLYCDGTGVCVLANMHDPQCAVVKGRESPLCPSPAVRLGTGGSRWRGRSARPRLCETAQQHDSRPPGLDVRRRHLFGCQDCRPASGRLWRADEACSVA